MEHIGQFCCKNCGCNTEELLQFHHRDGSDKEFILSTSRDFRSPGQIERAKKEAEKCDVLCMNCHAEIHEKEWLVKRKAKVIPAPDGFQCTICKGFFTPDSFDKTTRFKEGTNRDEYMPPCKFCHYIRDVKNKRIKAVELAGGHCLKCGYNKSIAALEFHHDDPPTKEFCPSEMMNLKWERILKEISKCTLLCANCHRLVENEKKRKRRLERQGLLPESTTEAPGPLLPIS